MRILVASKFWYRRGGLERVMFDEIGWLEGSGHEIAHFSTQHPQNTASPWSDYFAPYLELGASGTLSTRQKLTAAGRMFWNREAAASFDRLIREFRPDVIHVHGIHRQLSPSIVRAAFKHRVPVVQTLHDYHPICPGDVLLRGGSRVCEPPLCRPSKTSPCARNRCVRGSLAASVLSAAEARYRARAIGYGTCVSRLISPSAFLAALVARSGLTAAPIEVIPNAVPVSDPTGIGDYFLFAGRLSPEKGVATLIDAAVQAQVRVVIAGDGPLMSTLAAKAGPKIEFLGHVDGQRVGLLLRECRAAVVPSEWYENAPMSVLEAMAAAKAVIASSIGGIPEQVIDGETGILVEPGNKGGLAAALVALAGDDELARRLGAAGLERVRLMFTPERHLYALENLYRGVAPRA